MNGEGGGWDKKQNSDVQAISTFCICRLKSMVWAAVPSKSTVGQANNDLRSRSLDGLGVAFQVLMPEESGSNPEAGSIYSFDEVCPGLGLLQPQWNPYPTLTPPSC